MPDTRHPRGARCGDEPRTTIPIETSIPGAIGETWDDLAHVVAGKEQKIRFCNRLFDWLDRH